MKTLRELNNRIADKVNNNILLQFTTLLIIATPLIIIAHMMY